MKAAVIPMLVGVLLLVGCGGDSTEKATVTSATPTMAAPTKPPSGAEVGTGEYGVGDSVAFSSHTLTVNSFERDELLIVNVTFENLSPRNFILKPDRLFDAFDSEGNRLEHHPMDEPMR